MNLSLHSRIILYPLIIRQDKNHYIVEESISGDFFEMPEVAVQAIHQINQEKSLSDIELDLRKHYPDEEVDMVAFVEQLLELGLVKEADGESVEDVRKSKSPEGFQWIPKEAGKFFFNRITMKIYIALILFNILLLFFNPKLIPHYQDMFLFETMMFNILLYMGISFTLIMVHEFGHILAIRAHGLPVKLEIGHRLFLVVFETDLTSAWKLEPKQRNPLYLGGIFFDQSIIFVSLSLLVIFPGMNQLLAGILAIFVLDLFIKTIYQCCFYMKTDLYFLCENVTGCYNLMENGKQMLHKWLPFIKADHTAVTFEREKRVVLLYSIFYIGGLLLTAVLFFVYFAPQLLYAYAETIPDLMYPPGSLRFWDAAVFLIQTIIMLVLLSYSWMKSRREKAF